MQEFSKYLKIIDSFLGSANWFALLLLGTGVFFTLYLGFPQIRYFAHALRIVRGKYDKKSDKGDTTHFQALTTALSGTVGTGNIAGVAFALYLGGPAALFWMLVTASLGMTTKFVEVLLSHKYREFDSDGSVAGGPMYYMKHRLNIKLKSGKKINTGVVLGGIFAFATILSSFGTGNLPQINNIADSLYETFKINHMITGAILACLLALVIIGGIKRIAKVTEKLVPTMALFYLIGAIAVLVTNSENILSAIKSIFTHVFTGSAAMGGFLGASLSFAFSKGVGRGLFSNEAGQGSAPIAHAAAKAHEPVSEGMVAILEPFIDTIIICFLTGLTILSSGVWKEKFENNLDKQNTFIVKGTYHTDDTKDAYQLIKFADNPDSTSIGFNGKLKFNNGLVTNTEPLTILSSRSIAEDVLFYKNTDTLYSGEIPIIHGRIQFPKYSYFTGKSLIHSAPLTTQAFSRGFKGGWGKYIVSIGLLLFAFSTAISWSYYGDRAVTYLFGNKYVIYYRIVYVLGFFVASFANTTLIWDISAITIVLMTLPNLIGLLLLSPEIKKTIKEYWLDFKNNKN